MHKLKTLEAKSFRGIRDSQIDFDGRSLILFGENGHGKSSFVDALEFFFTGSIAHLQGSEGVSVDRHGPHISGKREDAYVSLQFVGFPDILKRTLDDLPTIPPALNEYIQLGSEATFILRRKNLLDFVMAQAAPRYQQLAALIGIEDLDGVELALMRKRDVLQASLDNLTREEAESSQALEDLIGHHVDSDQEIINALNQRLSQASYAVLSSLGDIEKRKVGIVSGTKSPQNTQRAAELLQTRNTLNRVQGGLRFLQRYQELWSRLDELRKDIESARELAFERLLSVAKDILKSNELDYCPLCQRPVDRQELLKQVDGRLATLTAVSSKAAAVRTLASSLANEASQFVQALDNLERLIQQIRAPWDPQLGARLKASLNDLKTALSVEPFKMILKEPSEYMSDADVISFEFHSRNAAAFLESEQRKLADSGKDQEAVTLVDLLTEAKRLRDKLASDRTNRQKTERMFRIASGIYKTFTDTKKTEVQS